MATTNYVNEAEARMKVSLKKSFDGLMYDITGPDFPVSVEVGDGPQGKVLWVNLGPVCVLRICRIRTLELPGADV